jgi:aminoacyl-tRNA hydrolase/ribosomal protein bL25 (Ctc-form)
MNTQPGTCPDAMFATMLGRSPPRFPLPAATLKIMADSTKLSLNARDPEGSRTARRLRRTGQVPGVIYGEGGDPSHFSVDARILRNTLAHSGAILDVTLGGDAAVPVLVKDLQRHPVRGEIVHVDFLRVNMNETIHTTVVLELTGVDDAPGVTEGGVLTQETREINIEALPGDIPDSITHDVSGMQINDTLTLSAVTVPDGITLLDDLDETVIATITPPTVETESDDIGRRVLKLFASTPVDWLVVGLGNPGPGYAESPHNAGFKVADELARRWDLPKAKKKFAGELSEGRTAPGGPRVALLKPQTYMNEAGRSAGPARGSYKLDLDHVLVLHDEIDLPFGEVRVRLGGGLAGHNGLKSLKRDFGAPDFHRVRIGVGRPDSTDPDIVAAYVLGRWRQSGAEVADLVSRAADEAERLVLSS